MANDELCFLPITELAARIAARTLSPVELAQAYLHRIEQYQPVLNTYIAVCADSALDAARQAEDEIGKSGPRTPLHGIPIALKDNIDVAGLATTCASRVLESNIATTDAVAYARLQDAGAVLLGKLNMNEFATLVPSEHFGAVKNPWNVQHSPGGSSSGSGAAVAAGLCAAALGTDTGGSIRIPSTFCGITGLKATHGRISIRGIVPVAWSLDHVGPMTRSVADAAIMLDSLAAYDPADLVSREQPWSGSALPGIDTLRNLSDLKIAVADDLLNECADPEIVASMVAAVALLRDLGATVEHLELPELHQAWAIIDPIIQGEANAWHAPYLDEQPANYGAKVRKFLELGRDLSAQDYVRARGDKVRFKRHLIEQLAPYDALLAPGSLIPAPPLGARSVTINGRDVAILPAVVSATAPFNLTGQPVVALPTGCTNSGLPIGMQIIASRWREDVALRIGQAYQAHTDWHNAHPALA